MAVETGTPLALPPPSDAWSRRFNAYGALGVTSAIFGAFFFGMAITAWHNDTQSFNALLETVKTLVILAAGFWLGSSNSKRQQDEVLAASTIKKDETIAAQGVALATSTPVAATTTTEVDAKAGTATTTTGPAAEGAAAPVSSIIKP